MRIAGIGNSFVDYPGKIAMIIFIEGCNFNCYYCHNRAILRKNSSNVIYSPDMLITNLIRKKNFLDGVVISGGEPTISEKLPDFIKRIKDETGLAVKLDTNGTNPDMIKDLIKRNLINYIAMDIKASKDKYNKVCLCKVDLDAIQKSIDIILKGKIDYEFRTTFSPDLTTEDIAQIGEWIDGAKLYALQQYRVPPKDMYFNDTRLNLLPHAEDYINTTLETVRKHFASVVVRGL